ncbi:MAG: DUF3857 domain-containing protein [Dysgonamonadaceae bacterium]|jgi:hypothetical protein|nr:DUF3857 domain-containing protein [Dysgonamonadaceae bacterium]
MKKLTILLGCVLCIQLLPAQDKFKFGAVPRELLEMTVYDKDSTASSVVVHEENTVYYVVNSVTKDFEIITDYTVRIKILTSDGVDYANGAILFYKGTSSIMSENITGLTGWTYNLENGQIVKNKLSKEFIFTEDVTENLKRMKFALPSAKAGSVVEYKYTLRSPYYYRPENFQFQRAIPVQYSHFAITVPEYFDFNKETKGYERIQTTTKPVNLTFFLGGRSLTCAGEETSIEVFDLPALKEESFVWNINDFRTAISFELRQVSIPGVYYKDYSQTWNKIAERLAGSENFGKELKNKSLFKAELPAILSSEGSDEEKIRAILDLVRSKVKWNDRSMLWINNASKALKEGTGTSSEMNALLLNALKNAGYEACPVAICLRSRGRLPFTYPSIDNLNYFVVRVTTGDKNYYLDATHSYCDLNVIPTDCMVERALCIFDNTFEWVNLTTVGNNSERNNMLLSFNEDGILTGKRVKNYTGECAYSFKNSYENAKDEAEFIEKTETKNDISITEYALEEKRGQTYAFAETYHFTSNNIRLDDNQIVTFVPLLFETMHSNPFKSEERQLPIEFNYPEDDRININITIPAGYAVDEIPQSARFFYGENNQMEFSYMIQANEYNIQVAYRFTLNTSIIAATDYAGVRDFMAKVYAKCNEVVVLKKR